MNRVFLFVFLLLFSACSREQVPDDISTLFGPYTATGTISATGASLYRRGTHILSVENKPRFFLESKTVRLNDFEEGVVVVEGELSPNTHPRFFPVIQVNAVRNAESIGTVLKIERYAVSALSLSLEAPIVWQSDISGGRLTFTYPSEESPFIAIEHSTMPDLPEGIPVRIGSKNGIRSVESGAHRVYVLQEEGDAILFTFGPKGVESAKLRDAFYTMLRSVEFEGSGEEVDEEPLFQGSKQPCGGIAKVLCPDGEFCDVQEMDTGIGVCRSL
ncbi:MAG TPA: hypothetical protein VJB82_01995 [Candidatus Peribacterales bacterium]|nr:hypothetical protein [Candidatus Peribacterales bacterium]